MVHPSAVISWAKYNYPRTLLWEVKEQTGGRVLIRHITFLMPFERSYVPIVRKSKTLDLFTNYGVLQ